MRKFEWAAIAAVVLGVAWLSLSTSRAADPPSNAPPDKDRARVEVPSPTLPPGITQKDLKEEHAIRSAFGAFEKAALTPNGFSDVADCLVEQDRDRVKQYKQEKTDVLNDVINKIQGQWKTKFNQDFDITRAERQKAFSGIAIVTGEIDNPDLLAGQWPVAQPLTAAAPEAQPAASKTDIERAKDKYFGGDVKLDKGRDVGVAQVPEMLGLPAIRCSLIKEHVSGWKFDLPNNISGQQLHDNLVKQLTMVADHPEQWPSNVDETYGLIGHHAVMALYGVEASVTRDRDRRSNSR